jgi:uncharacterized protein (DUF427 family)
LVESLSRRVVEWCGAIEITEEEPMKAIWKDTLLAESDDTVVVEGNHYFPIDAIKRESFQPSATHAFWRGVTVTS